MSGHRRPPELLFFIYYFMYLYGRVCVLFVKMRQSSSYLGSRLVFRVQEERQSLSRLRRYQLGSRLIFGVQERCLSLVRRGVHVIARMHVIS